MLSRSIDVEIHAHHALQLTFGLERSLTLQHGGHQIEAQSIFISSNIPHLIDSKSSATINYLIHPESQLGRKLQHQFKERSVDIVEHIPMITTEDWSAFTCENVLQISDTLWSNLLLPCGIEETIDPRIQEAIEYIKKMEIIKVSVDTLAELVHLSSSRFMYLFRQNTGVSVRRYVLWYRLIKAATQIMRGESFTNAAHEVGFSDSAHLTRTFKQMFGITLQGVFKDDTFVQASFCMNMNSPSK